MYKCTMCSEVFEAPKKYTEKHGLDTPPYEEYTGCPKCAGDYEEAVKCEMCGEYYADYELTNGVCDDCIYEHISLDNLLEFGGCNSTTIDINGFLASMFTRDMIEGVLSRILKQAEQVIGVDYADYLIENKEDITEYLKGMM